MSNRETLTIKTTGGHEVVYKSYATGRENNEIQKVYLSGAKVEVIEGISSIKEVSPTIQFEVEKKMVEVMVVSLDGVSENVVDNVLDLPNGDYQEIVKALDALFAKKKSE